MDSLAVDGPDSTTNDAEDGPSPRETNADGASVNDEATATLRSVDCSVTHTVGAHCSKSCSPKLHTLSSLSSVVC